ncbi:hypothetical protein FIV42_21210 [Persicimonas caeni]|uniref:Outer membrane lipoprotein-sorting protein n=1 Tax=Persicimonas caeni TaxID=2292766 RepID=A0A4Y6PY64_PERCE|nr:hypothetical protein [Persicimonas caeni]QDG53170.1 hypothetical protein FIV42_21210 [Persicimonas caeni]QED34392.1 hypothetical protein FRD00_21205 [Persicimonas caeni]
MNPRILLVLVAAFALAACQSTPEAQPQQDPVEEEAAEEVAEEFDDQNATPPENWVTERVAESKERLQATEAGTLVWKSIEAHGGLQRWFENGPLHFRFDYRPLGEGKPRDTYQTVDTWSSRARHQMADDRDVEFGWDGEQAWQKPADADIALNPRFWALTPYYFVAMPFVLGDPGVNLELVGDEELQGQTYEVVKATFSAGTGDAPDDYYVLYFHPDTHKLRALRYVVSYPGFFPEGGHTPEKLMIYEGEQTVDGITFAKNFPTHKWDTEAAKPLDKVTAIEMSDVEFRPGTPQAYFEMPEGAKALEGY